MSRSSNSGRGKGAPSFKTLPLDSSLSLQEQVARSLKSPFRPVLVVLVGNETGQRKPLDGTVDVGRDPSSQLMLTDAGVSWKHARVEDRGDAWVVVDLGSTNGTKVNDERVAEQALAKDDKISFGRTVVRFEVQDAYDQAYDAVVERMLNIDDLSGLYVRRKFDAELERMIVEARGSSGTVALLVMDLDGIKGINDSHGHLFGAYVIGESGHVIGQVIGDRGIGSRFGGDEFLAALPGKDLDGAVAIAEEIRAAIGTKVFEREGIRLRPGISIGAAAFPAQAQDARSLFQRADEAMYRAKVGGKNRVCI